MKSQCYSDVYFEWRRRNEISLEYPGLGQFVVGYLTTIPVARLHNVKWMGEGWIWKNLEGSGLRQIYVLLRYLPGRIRHKTGRVEWRMMNNKQLPLQIVLLW